MADLLSTKSGAIARGHRHQFVAPTPAVDSRSPCPALNALANHNYLPHDGRNIGFWDLVRAQREVYNFSYPLAILLALAGVIMCGHFGILSLADLSAHNRIEHDGSIVHANASTGDATSVDPELMQSLLADCTASKGSALSLDDYVRAKIRREASIIVPLSDLHAEIARGEFGMLFHLFGKDHGTGPEVSKERLVSWLRDERLPDDWTAPEKQTGLLDAAAKSKQIKKLVEARKQKKGPQY